MDEAEFRQNSTWVLKGSGKDSPYYNRDPRRDHNFDNHPYGASIGPSRVMGRAISEGYPSGMSHSTGVHQEQESFLSELTVLKQRSQGRGRKFQAHLLASGPKVHRGHRGSPTLLCSTGTGAGNTLKPKPLGNTSLNPFLNPGPKP